MSSEYSDEIPPLPEILSGQSEQDTAAATRARAAVNIKSAMGVNPLKEVEKKRVAEHVGFPLQLVDDEILPELNNQVTVKKLLDESPFAPTVLDMIANQNGFAHVSGDADIQPLMELEKSFRSYKFPSLTEDERRRLEEYGEEITGRVLRDRRRMEKATEGGYSGAQNALRRGFESAALGGEFFRAEVGNSARRLAKLPLDVTKGFIPAAARASADLQSEIDAANERFKLAAEEFNNLPKDKRLGLASAIYEEGLAKGERLEGVADWLAYVRKNPTAITNVILESLPASVAAATGAGAALPAGVSSAIARVTGTVAGTFGAGVGPMSAENIEAGMGPEAARSAGALEAGVDGLVNAPFAWFGAKLNAAAEGKSAIATAGIVAAEGVVAGVGGGAGAGAGALAVGKDFTIADFLGEAMADVVTTPAAAAAAGFAANVENRRRDEYQARIDAAVETQARVSELMKKANSVAMLQHSPETFEQFVEAVQATREGDLKEVVVDAARLLEVGGQASIERLAQEIPGFKESFEQSVAGGGDVVIPLAKLFTVYGDKEAEITKIIREDADAIAAEDAEALKADMDRFNQEIAQARGDIAKSESWIAETDDVFNTVLADLENTQRFTSDVNKQYAELWRSAFSTIAERTGTTPKALFDRFTKANNITPTERAAGPVLDTGVEQDVNTPEFKEWSAGAPVVRAKDSRTTKFITGEKVVVEGYHGGASDIREFSAQSEATTEGGASLAAQGVQAFFFSNDADVAGSFADGAATADRSPNITPVYIAFKNPYVIEADGKAWAQFADRVAEIARGGEHDGVIFKDVEDTFFGDEPVTRSDVFVAFRSNQIKSVFNKRPTSGPDIANQSTDLRRGTRTLRKYGLKPGGRYTTRQVAAALEARQREKWGEIPSKFSSDEERLVAEKKIASWMAEEVEFEMENPETSGVGWYSEKFQAALDVMAGLYPELAADKVARNTMTALIAVTSDGQAVLGNFQMAMEIYEGYRNTGKFELGERAHNRGSIAGNLETLQKLHDEMGAEAMHEYLMREDTVKNLKRLAKSAGGTFSSDYAAGITVPIAALELGPKLGAFYANLMGAHGYLTMDRWWSRTFNRYRGTLLDAPTRAGLDRFKSLLGTPEMSDDEAISATVAPRNTYAKKGFKEGTEIEKAANTIYKAAFESLNDAPFRTSDRTFMLDAVNRAQKILKRRGVEMSIADIQAVLWYYEKQLYGSLGTRQSGKISYENAARRIVSDRAEGRAVDYTELGEDDDVAGTEGEVSPGEETFDIGRLDQEEGTREGRKFRNFFAGITSGQSGAPKIDASGIRVVNEKPSSVVVDEFMRHSGNFDRHIEASIPGFRDVQFSVANAIVKTFSDADVLDIGASEGALVKTVSKLGDNLRTVALDPNPAMRDTFNSKSEVEGSQYALAALGTQEQEGSLAWNEEDGTAIHYFKPDRKFDVVHEAMVFQFIDNNRDQQIARVAELMKDDGVAIFEEKFVAGEGLDTARWKQSEVEKDAYKEQFFSKEEMAAKADSVLVGMNKNMVSPGQFEATLLNNFKYAVQFWDSGNFKGYAASNDKTKLDALVANIGDMQSVFSTRTTPEEVSADSRLKQESQDDLFNSAQELEAMELESAKAKGLDMSVEARIARAKAMGFDTSRRWYHATNASGFRAFQLPGSMGKTRDTGIFMTDSERMAGTYMRGLSVDARIGRPDEILADPAKYGFEFEPLSDDMKIRGTDPNGEPFEFDNEQELMTWLRDDADFAKQPGMYELYLRLDPEKVFVLDWEGNSWSYGPVTGYRYDVYDDVRGKRVFDGSFFDEDEAKARVEELGEGTTYETRPEREFQTTDDAARWARENGFDAIEMRNVQDPGPYSARVGAVEGTTMVVFDPANIRSTKAAFDPEFSASADLLAQARSRSERNAKLGKVIAAAKKAEQTLSPEARRAVESWQISGWSSGELSKAFEGSGSLELADEIRSAFEPVRDVMREQFGDTIELYRGQRNYSADELSAERKLFSWSLDPAVAETYAYNGKLPKPMSDAEVSKAVEQYNRTGYVQVGRYKYVRSKAQPEYYNIYDGKEMITDGDDLEADLRDRQQTAVEAKEEMSSRGEVYAMATPVNEIVWVPGNLSSKEVITTLNPLRAKATSRPVLPQEREGVRGSFDVKTFNIALLTKADKSTFLHESGHFFFEMMLHLATDASAPQQVKDDVAAMLKFAGFSGTAADYLKVPVAQRRKSHEKLAETFEQYLWTGKAPTVELQPLFRTFARFLRQVYGQILAKVGVGGHGDINPELSAIFDRMLAADDAIERSREIRGYMPMHEEAPPGMSEEEFIQYQKDADKSRSVAEESLRARLMRDMRWLTNLKGQALKEVTLDAKAKRKAVRDEVTSEVNRMRVYRVQEFLKRGTMLDATGEVMQAPWLLESTKLNKAAVEAMRPRTSETVLKKLGFGKYGMVAAEGVDPGVVAGLFGYRSADEMLSDLVTAEKKSDLIDGLTEQRMLERHADIATPEDLQRAADALVANEAHSRMVATELANLEKRKGKTSVLRKAAKYAAMGLVARRLVKDARPDLASAAASRARRQAAKALGEGKREEAAAAKRNEMLHVEMEIQLKDFRKEVEKALRQAAKVFKGTGEKVSKSRDVDLVNASRMVLGKYGIGSPAGAARAQSYAQLLATYDGNRSDQIKQMVATLPAAKDYKLLTVDEFKQVIDVAFGLYDLAAAEKQVTVDGVKVAVDDIATQVVAAVEGKHGGTLPSMPGERSTSSRADERTDMLLSLRAVLTRVETWANLMGAPFVKYFHQPVQEAVSKYKGRRKAMIARYLALLEPIKSRITYEPIASLDSELNGFVFSAGKSELLHAVLHTGNESNKRKLLLGRGWAKPMSDGTIDTRGWDSFLERMIAEGVFTKEDMDFVQGVWDLLDDLKPDAQASHKAVYGYYFNEITANEVVTPWGTYRGGYVPAVVDPLSVPKDEANKDAEAVLQSGNSFAFPSTGKGFTMARVEYNKPLELDLRVLASHIDKVCRFTDVQPVVLDVAKLLGNRRISNALNRHDRTTINQTLIPWLQVAANQQASKPGRSKYFDKLLNSLNSRSGMVIMFAHVINTLQQLTSVPVALVKTDVTGKYLIPPMEMLKSIGAYSRDPKGFSAMAAEKSAWMDDRLSKQTMEMFGAIDRILINPNIAEKSQQFFADNAYFMQTALQNMLDVVVWTAAYNNAIAKGANDKQAVRAGDEVVRTTMGSFAPEDVSAFEVTIPFVKLFTKFYGFFNMWGNLLGSEAAKAMREAGYVERSKRLAFLYFMGLAIPAYVAGVMAQGLPEGDDDDDDDGLLDEYLAQFFMQQVTSVSAMIPVVGQLSQLTIAKSDDKPFNDRLNISPTMSMVESGWGAGVDAVRGKFLDDKVTKKEVRDAATLIGLATGVPLGPLVRAYGYEKDLDDGKKEERNAIGDVWGYATGK